MLPSAGSTCALIWQDKEMQKSAGINDLSIVVQTNFRMLGGFFPVYGLEHGIMNVAIGR